MLNYLLFLSMVHEYAYFYEYIWKPVYYRTGKIGQPAYDRGSSVSNSSQQLCQ